MHPDPAWFHATVERMGDLVVAFDAAGIISYANPAATRLLGLGVGEAIGRSCLDFVHPDDLERAVSSLEYSERSRLPAEVPVRFRLRTSHGWRSFEVRGHSQATDPLATTSLIVARESDGADLLDELLESMVGGAPDAVITTLIARLGVRDLWENELAVVSWRAEEELEVVDTGLAEDLVALLRYAPDAPWHAARRSGGLEGGPVDELPDELGTAVHRSGFEAVYAVPVGDPVSGLDSCIVSFGPAWLGVNLGYEHTLQRCARFLRIAEQRRAHVAQLERTARSDPLTGIANRRRFLHALDELLADHARGVVPTLSVVYADLDDFKPVNDAHGHAAGDVVLRAMADRLVLAAGPGGLAARLGGDEFAVVAPVSPDELMARLRPALAEPIRLLSGQLLAVHVSLGGAAACVGDDAGLLLDAADRACYRDKRSKAHQTS